MTTDWSRCFLCGSADAEADSPRGSPTCATCRPIREHVVSMQTAAGGGSLAVCQCGWTSKATGGARYIVQDARVRIHWREAIRRKLAEVDAEFGAGTVERQLQATALGLVGIVFVAVGATLGLDAIGAVAP